MDRHDVAEGHRGCHHAMGLASCISHYPWYIESCCRMVWIRKLLDDAFNTAWVVINTYLLFGFDGRSACT